MSGLVQVGDGPLDTMTTADEVAAAFLVGYGESTRKAYASDLRGWTSWLALDGIPALDARRVHVEAYMNALEAGGMKPATIARKVAVISGFYTYAMNEGVIARSPVANVRRPKMRDSSPTLGLDKRELKALLDVASRNPRDHALALLLAVNGLRVSEALSVDVGDLDREREHRVLKITRKGGIRAVVPLAPVTARAIDELVAQRPAGTSASALFATSSGRRLDRQHAHKIVRRLARDAGIEKAISPHSLRHSYVTLALDAGASLRDVQDGAGHADPRTTRRYDRDRHALDRNPTYAVAAALG